LFWMKKNSLMKSWKMKNICPCWNLDRNANLVAPINRRKEEKIFQFNFFSSNLSINSICNSSYLFQFIDFFWSKYLVTNKIYASSHSYISIYNNYQSVL
jgi:hypothetical protein